VIFPLYDEAGDLVAANGRYVDGRDDPKTRSAGPKSNGLFCAHAVNPEGEVIHALDKSSLLVLTEAPIDALSLAACGVPAIALVGTSGPAWLHRLCGLRRVVLALDDDEAGDKAATTIAEALKLYGAKCERLRPLVAKDWNGMYQTSGPGTLAAYLALNIQHSHILNALSSNAGTDNSGDAPLIAPVVESFPGLELINPGRWKWRHWYVPTRATLPAYDDYGLTKDREKQR
jgi:DNA primase